MISFLVLVEFSCPIIEIHTLEVIKQKPRTFGFIKAGNLLVSRSH